MKDDLQRKQLGRRASKTTPLTYIWKNEKRYKRRRKMKMQYRNIWWSPQNQGPRVTVKQKHPFNWSSGIMPPPLLVSITSNIFTTSLMSGRFSAFASQHLRMMFANEFGQHRGISGRKFYSKPTQSNRPTTIRS